MRGYFFKEPQTHDSCEGNNVEDEGREEEGQVEEGDHEDR